MKYSIGRELFTGNASEAVTGNGAEIIAWGNDKRNRTLDGLPQRDVAQLVRANAADTFLHSVLSPHDAADAGSNPVVPILLITGTVSSAFQPIIAE